MDAAWFQEVIFSPLKWFYSCSVNRLFLIFPEFSGEPNSPQLSAGWSSRRKQLHLWGKNEAGVHLWRINGSIKFYCCTAWIHAKQEWIEFRCIYCRNFLLGVFFSFSFWQLAADQVDAVRKIFNVHVQTLQTGEEIPIWCFFRSKGSGDLAFEENETIISMKSS